MASWTNVSSSLSRWFCSRSTDQPDLACVRLPNVDILILSYACLVLVVSVSLRQDLRLNVADFRLKGGKGQHDFTVRPGAFVLMCLDMRSTDRKTDRDRDRDRDRQRQASYLVQLVATEILQDNVVNCLGRILSTPRTYTHHHMLVVSSLTVKLVALPIGGMHGGFSRHGSMVQ
jgi:hypothetical protein